MQGLGRIYHLSEELGMVSGCGFARMFICRQIRDFAGLEVTIHNLIISGLAGGCYGVNTP
jgi:hypothetical protein